MDEFLYSFWSDLYLFFHCVNKLLHKLAYLSTQIKIENCKAIRLWLYNIFCHTNLLADPDDGRKKIMIDDIKTREGRKNNLVWIFLGYNSITMAMHSLWHSLRGKILEQIF